LVLASSVACSSSSQGGGGAGNGDGGGASSSGGSQSDDGSTASEGGEGGGGSDGGDASVCKVPAGAEMMTQTEAGVIGCSAVTSNTLCDPQYRLICRAPDPTTGVPVPPSSLGCTLQPNTGDPAVQYYCCPCQ